MKSQQLGRGLGVEEEGENEKECGSGTIGV